MTASSGHRWDLVTLGDLVADLIVPIPSLPIEAGRHQLAKWMQLEAGGTCNTLIMAQRLGLCTVAIGAMSVATSGPLWQKRAWTWPGCNFRRTFAPVLPSSWLTIRVSMSSSVAWTEAHTNRSPSPGRPSFDPRAGSL